MFSADVKPCPKTFTCTGTQPGNKHFHWLHLKLRDKSHSFNITESQQLKTSETRTTANYSLREIKLTLYTVVLFDFSTFLKQVPPFLDDSLVFLPSFTYIDMHIDYTYLINTTQKCFHFFFFPPLTFIRGNSEQK